MKMTDEKLEYLVQAKIQALKYEYYVKVQTELKEEKKRLHNAYMEELKLLEERRLDWKALKAEKVSEAWYAEVKAKVMAEIGFVSSEQAEEGVSVDAPNPVLLNPAIFG